MSRHYSAFDHFLMHLDQGIRTVFAPAPTAQRENPANAVNDGDLSNTERQQNAALMRVNHAGEVSAQALYQGQALTARLDSVREKMHQAAEEEYDHLAWCEQRLQELNSHTSYLNPLWYCGSFMIGALAGWVGDRWSLGFIAATEHQVIKHLESHLEQLPQNDEKSRAILQQMQIDEGHHATVALEAGAATFPKPIQVAMSYCSKVMTKTAYWV